MNVTRSRSITAMASPASQRAIGRPACRDAASSTPFNSPETWAIGDGRRMQSPVPSRCTAAIVVALCTSARWVCRRASVSRSIPTWRARRRRRRGRPGDGAPPTGAPSGRAPGSRHVECRADAALGRFAAVVRWAGEVVDRGGHRADAPAGAVEHDGDRARSGAATTPWLPGSTPAATSPPATLGDAPIECRRRRRRSSSRLSALHGHPAAAHRSVSGWS